MPDPRVTYEVKPLLHTREPGRTSYRVIRRVTVGNSDVVTMEVARYAHESAAKVTASHLRLSAHDEEHDHYPSAEEEVEVITFADAAQVPSASTSREHPNPGGGNEHMETFYEVKPTPFGAFRVVRVERTGSGTHRTEVARYDSEFIAGTVARFLNGLTPEEAAK